MLEGDVVIWLFAGLLVGFINALLVVRTVAKVRPDASYPMYRVVIRGWLVRLGLATLVLALAVREDISSGLVTFAGLWLARWVLVGLTQRERIPWALFDV
jgi:hypothetical protein